jgi:hypothetical protein
MPTWAVVYRTLIGTNLNNRWIFVFGFAKNELDTLDEAELSALQKYARFLLSLPQNRIQHLIDNNELIEVLPNETK